MSSNTDRVALLRGVGFEDVVPVADEQALPPLVARSHPVGRRRWTLQAVAALACALAGELLGAVIGGGRPTPSVSLAPAAPSASIAFVEAVGFVAPLRQSIISSDEIGRVAELYVTEGEHVRRGQPIAQLDHVRQQIDLNRPRGQRVSTV